MGSKNIISVGFVNEKWLKQSTYILPNAYLGTITSPDYPNTYTGGIDYVVVIEAGESSSKIQGQIP